MTIVTRERAVWLREHVLPREPEVRSWLGRRGLSGGELDDVIQESYAILAGLRSVDHIRDPRIYFFQVAKSVVLQTLRRSRVILFSALAEFDALSIPDDRPSPEEEAEGREELGRLARLIEKLPAKCREAFVLRKVAGLSQREVAAAMRVSENTIEKHIGKAMAILGGAIGRGGTRRLAPSNVYEPMEVDEAGHAP